MRRFSSELEERLKRHGREENWPPPVSFFVAIHWPWGVEREEGLRCYSTIGQSVKMDGILYSGERGLLDFEGKRDRRFVMSSDHLIYGPSCGFRVLDDEGLAERTVRTANRRGDFPAMFVEVWWHFSIDPEEIASLLYGERLFGGYVTRIELHGDKREEGRVAVVWGGYEGIVVSRARKSSGTAASALGRPIALGGGIAEFFGQGQARLGADKWLQGGAE